MELSAQDIDKAKFAFSIYDFDGTEKIDGINLADCLRALDLTPSLKTIKKFGATQKKGEKAFSVEEFLSIFAEAKKDKDVGCLEDYVEVLKCYDKYNDGYMPASSLQHMLLSSGERMDNASVQLVMDECCDPPDEDGLIKYIPFITKICTGPVSAFDSVDFNSSASSAPPTASSGKGGSAAAAAAAAGKKMRPSITVDDADAPSVSFAAAKPMSMSSRKGSDVGVAEEEEPAASFTLKAPRRSSSITPPDA